MGLLRSFSPGRHKVAKCKLQGQSPGTPGSRRRDDLQKVQADAFARLHIARRSKGYYGTLKNTPYPISKASVGLINQSGLRPLNLKRDFFPGKCSNHPHNTTLS